MLGLDYQTHFPLTDGYVGCMRQLQVQQRVIDPVEVVHTQLGVGITLGPCQITDWCRVNGSRCQNAARCISEWDKTSCDCSATQFTGKFCQFGEFPIQFLFSSVL